MKRTRRNFTPEFKAQVVKTILTNQMTRRQIAAEHAIALPLLERWINDYVAKNQGAHKQETLANVERRRNWMSEQELKLKIAELYMRIDKMEKSGLTYRPGYEQQKEV